MRLWRDLLWNPRVLIPTVVPGKFLYAFWRDLLWNNFAFDEVNVQVVVRFLYAFWRDLLWSLCLTINSPVPGKVFLYAFWRDLLWNDFGCGRASARHQVSIRLLA